MRKKRRSLKWRNSKSLPAVSRTERPPIAGPFRQLRGGRAGGSPERSGSAGTSAMFAARDATALALYRLRAHLAATTLRARWGISTIGSSQDPGSEPDRFLAPSVSSGLRGGDVEDRCFGFRREALLKYSERPGGFGK